jgi:hypothetical protein
MKTTVIEIDAGVQHCENCIHIGISSYGTPGWCHLFKDFMEPAESEYERLPECLSGEEAMTLRNVGARAPFQMGWVCPVCGRGNAPMTQTCPCMGWQASKVTC